MKSDSTRVMDEGERVALVLLSDHIHISAHPVLGAWVRALLADIDEHRCLDEWAWDNRDTPIDDARDAPSLSQFCAMVGYAFPAHAYDPAVLALAQAVCRYREQGRVGGDYTSDIMGMGAPVMLVTTSLAAAIVEYHRRYVNVVIRQLKAQHERSAPGLAVTH